MKICRCRNKVRKLFGVYCSKCVEIFKKAKLYSQEVKAPYRALDFGSGDLWRFD